LKVACLLIAVLGGSGRSPREGFEGNMRVHKRKEKLQVRRQNWISGKLFKRLNGGSKPGNFHTVQLRNVRHLEHPNPAVAPLCHPNHNCHPISTIFRRKQTPLLLCMPNGSIEIHAIMRKSQSFETYGKPAQMHTKAQCPFPQHQMPPPSSTYKKEGASMSPSSSWHP
jgi:hypothetical protein